MFGQKPQQPQQQIVGIPTNVDSHDMMNANPRELDVEFQKHILDINPLQLAFYKVFAGWREVTDEDEKTMYGIRVPSKKTKFDIDWFSRSANESGANFLFSEIIPLVHPTSATSKVTDLEIYNLWHGHMFTIRTTLLSTYYYPTYICLERTCNFTTPNFKIANIHKKNASLIGSETHEFMKVINPYELNIQRYPNIISMLLTLYMITKKAAEGFTLEQLAQSFMTSNIIRNGYVPPQQTGGLMEGLRNLTGR